MRYDTGFEYSKKVTLEFNSLTASEQLEEVLKVAQNKYELGLIIIGLNAQYQALKERIEVLNRQYN